jgi:Glycosyltransferase sugar-binding region containing DXD motif
MSKQAGFFSRLLMLLSFVCFTKWNLGFLERDDTYMSPSLLPTEEDTAPCVVHKYTRSENPLQEVIKLAGSFDMTAIEGQTYCNQTFPNSTIPLFYVDDRIVTPPQETKRQIPMMIHMTSHSRCMSKPLFDNINTWKEALPNHSFFLHDTQAKERFFQQAHDAPESHLGFPYMTLIGPCLKVSGATLSDVWRYMFMYQYGGLYVDIDDGPGESLRQKIDQFASSEAILVQYEAKLVAQNFFMVMPGHPLMQFAMLETTLRLLSLSDVGAQYIPYTTGPQAFGIAYHKFMGVYDIDPPNVRGKVFWKGGHHVGYGNWSVDVAASWNTKKELINTFTVLDDVKKEYYAAVNAADYERDKRVVRKLADNKSCFFKIVDSLIPPRLS